MTQAPIEITIDFYFPQISMVKLLETLHTVLDVQMLFEYIGIYTSNFNC